MNRLFTTFARYLHPRGAVSFWHTAVGPMCYDYSTIDDYYIDLRAKTSYSGPYDTAGIPLLDYFGSIGKQYNPCAVAQWGLGAFQCWKRGDADCEALFIRAVEWLVSNLSIDDQGRGFWWYNFDFDAYGLRKPWASALAQAQGISVLLRAHHETGREGFLHAAQKAFQAMVSPVDAGGLLLREGDNTFLEEVVADRPTAILDGLIFAVFGLRDYCLVHGDDTSARRLLEDCLKTIECLLPRYDLGYWSRADLYAGDPPMPASRFYHGLHVAQLRVLADATGNHVFDEYSRRWASLSASLPNRIRAFFQKLIFKFMRY